jgi:hypothetical protein
LIVVKFCLCVAISRDLFVNATGGIARAAMDGVTGRNNTLRAKNLFRVFLVLSRPVNSVSGETMKLAKPLWIQSVV